ncbi:hypothetical protein OG579_19040 [Williamsia herbipolensis]|uniref:Uncharacterized protein n=1 Tax=Williamsia herbipolensis TaxID=1603258 RepID=A0AAU4K121_9NOCA|nr:hypothetical protein [Williamsia herbipolensis]
MTTNDGAQQGLVQRMQQTADSLPWPVVFSKQLPGLQSGKLSPGPTPADGDDANPDQPYSWSYPMWVLLPQGITAGEVKSALNQNWRTQNFQVSERESGTVTAADREGYVFGAQTSAQGYLSLSIESPCFPKSQLNRSFLWPDRIESDT